MKNFKSLLSVVIFGIILFPIIALSQPKVVVLPFQNMDGHMDLNTICYEMQDSVFKAFEQKDQAKQYLDLIPLTDVEEVLFEMNLDPANPQYPSDMWKAVKKLGAQYVILGTFNVQANRILMNTYIYDVDLKLAYPDYQALDMFKPQENILENVPFILESLFPFFVDMK
jgi:TolB-like protein